MTPERESLAIDGYDVTLWRGGSGAPLVFLHDVLGPIWEGLPDRLARKRTVILPALLGFPGSAYREDLDTWRTSRSGRSPLEQRGLRGADVVAEGYGGWLAAEVGTRWPDAIGRLVLVSPMGLRLASARRKRSSSCVAPRSGDALRRRELRTRPAARARHADQHGAVRDEAHGGPRRGPLRMAPYLHNPKLLARLARVKSRR
jgi:pimeloyl-ACP methyl ester carboxylesterase